MSNGEYEREGTSGYKNEYQPLRSGGCRLRSLKIHVDFCSVYYLIYGNYIALVKLVLKPSLSRGVIPTGLAVGNDRRIPTSELPIHECPRVLDS
jgi:hypothetical protein